MEVSPSAPPAAPSFSLAQIVQARQAIKDARTAKRHAWEKEDLALEEDQHKLDMVLLSMLNQTGANSINTDYGTVIRSLKVKPSAADWGAIHRWIVENDAFDLLERRLKVTFVKEYMEEHDGALPPGINVHREYEVSVRRPSTKSTSEEGA